MPKFNSDWNKEGPLDFIVDYQMPSSMVLEHYITYHDGINLLQSGLK